jgi:hypothetical protein
MIVAYTIVVSFWLFLFERLLWLICLPLVLIALPFRHMENGLYKLPFWIDWACGNKHDGFGDFNYATHDCAYDSLASYNDARFRLEWFTWLMFRNPMHNLCDNVPLFNCDFSKVSNVMWSGDEVVDNRSNADGSLQTGFQVCWATGSWYLRSGVFWVFKLSSTRVFRFRVGFKLQPRHVRQEERVGKVLWTFSPINFKKVIPYGLW